VDWDSFNPNFFVIASSSLLRDSPANLITSFYLPPDSHKIIPELARLFPSVTVIDIGVIMQQVRKIMDRAALAIEFIFLFTLLAGLLVMVAAIQAGQDERRQETSLMRVLGATRRQVLTGLLVEFAIVGVVTGVFASAAASIAAYFLATQVFDLIYTPKQGYRSNARFVMNRSTQGTIRKFKDADGNYIWQPGIAAGQPATLMGYPVVESEDMPDIASDSYSIAFGDFSA